MRYYTNYGLWTDNLVNWDSPLDGIPCLQNQSPEICGGTPSPSCPVDLTSKDGGGFGPFSKSVASGAVHASD